VNIFVCDYCRKAQVVQRRGAFVSLKSPSNAIANVDPGLADTPSGLAIQRLTSKKAELAHRLGRLKAAQSAHCFKAALFLGGGHIVLSVIVFAIVAGIPLDENPSRFPVATLLFIIIAGVGLWAAKKRQDSVEKQYAPEISAIDQRLESIDDQLERHRRIVAGPAPGRYSNLRKPKSRQPRYR
jgi:hypothetical protein